MNAKPATTCNLLNPCRALLLLQGLGKPVVVTGSIIPMCEVSVRAANTLQPFVLEAATIRARGCNPVLLEAATLSRACQVYNDARRNLIVSVMFAAQLELSEVGILCTRPATHCT